MNAVEAAVSVARAHGLRVDEPRMLKDGHNLVVRLAPAPVVARVAQSIEELRPRIRARELAVTQWLAERGLPVLPVSDLLPPGPHACAGLELTFWPFVAEQLPPDGRAAGRALRAIDDALRDCPLELGGFWPIYETRALNERLGLPVFVEEVRADVENRLEYEPVGLHGDAHFRNCFFTEDGPLWGDLEDSCFAPPEWDAACLELLQRVEGRDAERDAALAELDVPDAQRLELLVTLRAVINVTWGAFLHGQEDPRIQERIEWLRRNVG